LNRRGLMMLGQHSIKICIRQKIRASLVYLDLDNFKPINDTFGHAEGDRVLTAFANKIGELCRESDIFARIGGDEFVMLLMNTSKAEAEDMILRFQQSLTDYNQSENQKENQKENQNYNIEFSHGIVEFNPYQHPSLEALLADGDRLMYENKKKTKTS
jgi:diguanylate cyclase (GGDEF)-like protein